MKRALGAGLLAGGVVLAVFGFQAKDSMESKFTELVKGSPSNKVMWLLGGGAALGVAGLVLILGKK